MINFQKAIEARARRAAASLGLVARKSRRRVGSLDNYGEFMLVDPSTSAPVAGWHYDMTAQEVIKYCAD